MSISGGQNHPICLKMLIYGTKLNQTAYALG